MPTDEKDKTCYDTPHLPVYPSLTQGGILISGISKKKTLAIFLAILLLCAGISASSIPSLAASSSKAIGLSFTSKTLEVGDQTYLSAYSSSNHTPSFKSSNPSVASINKSGKITAKTPGTALITASIQGRSAVCTIKVKKTHINICTTGVHIEQKGSYRLRATASNYGDITWRSKNPSVATVSQSGVVTGKKPGVATIVASTKGASATCTVTVKAPMMLISKTTVTLKPGESTRIVATTSSSMIPIWSSSNPSVASVDSKGKVTAHKKGSATICAKVDGVQRQCIVTVK